MINLTVASAPFVQVWRHLLGSLILSPAGHLLTVLTVLAVLAVLAVLTVLRVLAVLNSNPVIWCTVQ